MHQTTPYKTPSTFEQDKRSNEQTNALVQSLQESGLGDLVHQANDEVPMEQDDPSKENSSESESDDEKETWERLMTRYLGNILTKGDAQRAVRLLKQLDGIESFHITDDSVLYFKKKKLGNIFLLMYFFFGGERRDAMLVKQLAQFRKILQEHDIKVTQRKPYSRKAKGKTEQKKKKNIPAVNEDALSKLK
jgi:hypothetical protein